MDFTGLGSPSQAKSFGTKQQQLRHQKLPNQSTGISTHQSINMLRNSVVGAVDTLASVGSNRLNALDAQMVWDTEGWSEELREIGEIFPGSERQSTIPPQVQQQRVPHQMQTTVSNSLQQVGGQIPHRHGEYLYHWLFSYLEFLYSSGRTSAEPRRTP